jgi:hypothetical protein
MLKHPFTCIIDDPSSAGKSTFVITFLRNPDTLGTEHKFEGGIIWCYSEKTAIPHEELTKLKKNVRNHKRVPKKFDNVQG